MIQENNYKVHCKLPFTTALMETVILTFILKQNGFENLRYLGGREITCWT